MHSALDLWAAGEKAAAHGWTVDGALVDGVTNAATAAVAAAQTGMMAPLLTLKGPVRASLSDESFINPMRHLAKGEALGFDPRLCTGALDELEDFRLASVELGDSIKEGVVRTVIEPLRQIGESIDPLMSLSASTRARIPHWQEPSLGNVVTALRRHQFPPQHVDTLVTSLYLAREGGHKGSVACLRAWRVLRYHAQRFDSDAAVAAATAVQRIERTRGRRRRVAGRHAQSNESDDDDGDDDDKDDDDDEEEEEEEEGGGGGGALAIEDDAQYDADILELNACRRMLRLATLPLMKGHQIEALFSAFDTNKDGAISVDELERLLRMLDPHRRLERLKPVEMPQVQGVLEQAAAAVAPRIEQFGTLWRRHNPFRSLGAAGADSYDHGMDQGDDDDEH